MGYFKNLLWKIGSRQVREQLLHDSLKAWRIVQATNEESGITVIVIIRIEKPPLAMKKNLNRVIFIEWPFESEDSMPSEEEFARMQEFEEAVDELTGDNGFAEMVMARTGLGKRDWLFYTNDQDRFMTQFHILLSGHERYPIQVFLSEDPTWSHWQDMIDSLQAELTT